MALVGGSPASVASMEAKQRACAEAGIFCRTVHLSEQAGQAELCPLIQLFNEDRRIHGILVQTPLPSRLDEHEAFISICPEKDVDCCHPLNIGKFAIGHAPVLPCAPAAIQRLLLDSGYETSGKHVVICGRESLTARLLAQALVQKRPDANATVTLCDRIANGLPPVTREADIIVTALGQPESVTGAMVREGAVVVDASNNIVPDPSARRGYRVVGDVHLPSVLAKAEAVAPAPGGVGPMTIAMVLANTLALARRTAAG